MIKADKIARLFVKNIGGKKMSTDFTGYNYDQITQLSTKVASTSTQVAELIVSKLQGDIVAEIAKQWYAQEAVSFFQRFAEEVLKTAPHIQEIFEAYNKGIFEASEFWKGRTDTQASAVKSTVELPNMRVDVSAVEPLINGNAGIFEAGAEAVANKIPGVRADISNQLKVYAGSLEAASSFLGQGQAGAVEELFVRIQEEVAKIFRFLEEDANGPSLMSIIKQTVKDYQAAGQDVTKAFNSSGV